MPVNVNDRRETFGGRVAGTIGQIGGLSSGLLLDPGNINRWLRGLDKKEAQKVVSVMLKDHPKELGDVQVNLNGPDVVSDFKRIYHSKKLSIPEKLLGTIAAVPSAAFGAINRGDHYNPFSDSVVSYSGNPHVLEHELGHAVDFNQKKGLGRSLYVMAPSVSGAVGKLTGIAPLGNSIDAARQLYVEAKATQNSLKSTAKHTPSESAASRNVLFPAYGSYVGSAVGTVAGLGIHLTGNRIPGVGFLAGAAGPVAGALGGHAAARIYNAFNNKDMQKTSEELPTRKLQKRFHRLANYLRHKGADVNAVVPRVLVPKDKLTEQDILGLGFQPVVVAVPEVGQTAVRSFRHPLTNHHIHEHSGSWVMHDDVMPSTTMLMKRRAMALSGELEKVPHPEGKIKKKVVVKPGAVHGVATQLQGLPHLLAEGVPGMANYVSSTARGLPSMEERVLGTLDPNVLRNIRRWKPSNSYVPDPGVEKMSTVHHFSSELLKIAGVLRHAKQGDLRKTAFVQGDPNATSIMQQRMGEIWSHLLAMYLLYWDGHWKSAGDSQYGDHQLFDRLYSDVVKYLDEIAEKTHGYYGNGGFLLPQLMGLATQKLTELFSTGEDHLHMGMALEDQLQALLKGSHEELTKLGVLPLGLDDWLMGLASDFETHSYLLQQRCAGSPEVATPQQEAPPQEIAEVAPLEAGAPKPLR